MIISQRWSYWRFYCCLHCSDKLEEKGKSFLLIEWNPGLSKLRWMKEWICSKRPNTTCVIMKAWLCQGLESGLSYSPQPACSGWPAGFISTCFFIYLRWKEFHQEMLWDLVPANYLRCMFNFIPRDFSGCDVKYLKGYIPIKFWLRKDYDFFLKQSMCRKHILAYSTYRKVWLIVYQTWNSYLTYIYKKNLKDESNLKIIRLQTVRMVVKQGYSI